MSKKKLFAMTALVVILAILGTGTLAYFTTKAVVHNVITTGGVDIELVENFPGADENNVLGGIMPGAPVVKEVRVKNKDADAWVRMKVTVTCEGDPVDPDVVDIDYNLTDWVRDQKDPTIYYYKSVLPAPQGTVIHETTPLFTKVEFSGANMGNEYQNAEILVTVKAQGVQVANNGTTVLEAAGWPEF